MKSSEDELKNRGFLTEEESAHFVSDSEERILSLLNSKIAFQRTAGVRNISRLLDDKYLVKLCKLLEQEKKLYTKLEISRCLAKYGSRSVPYLLPLIGKIGTNQHREIKNVDLNKKSFPLPRDCVSRILVSIGPQIFDELYEVLNNGDYSQIIEVVDVVGHITWNYNDYSLEETLVDLYQKNQNNSLLKWKLIRAFQSFISEKIVEILNDEININENEVFTNEANRSLKRIRSRKCV